MTEDTAAPTTYQSLEMTTKARPSKADIDPHQIGPSRRTSYLETLINLIKGNIGCGMLAMGDAFKNGGMVFSSLMLVVIAYISCYNMYMLVVISNKFKKELGLDRNPGFADTIGLAFQNGSPGFKKFAPISRKLVDIFIVLTQLGFCCVYFLFISRSLDQIFSEFGIHINIQVFMLLIYPVILMTCLIRGLKNVVPLSLFANISMLVGIGVIIWESVKDLPPISSRRAISPYDQLPLFFGTAIYTFEGIGLVLPVQDQMKKKEQFLGPFGVLNVCMAFVLLLNMFLGFVGYLKYGDGVKDSLTLNLHAENLLTKVVIICMTLAILCTYCLQMFVPVVVLLPKTENFPTFLQKKHIPEYILRITLVTITFLAAELIPQLAHFVSLVGAIGCTFLALIFPPLAYMALRTERNKGAFCWKVIMDILTLLVGFFGLTLGTWFSIKAIIQAFRTGH